MADEDKPKLMTMPIDEIVQAAIEGLEAKKQRIDEVIAQIRERMNGGASTPTPLAAANGRRTMSAEARRRIAEAQRKRWAATRTGASAPPTAKKAKRHLSPEGRRRIIEATKKRWAAVRAAAKKVGK